MRCQGGVALRAPKEQSRATTIRLIVDREPLVQAVSRNASWCSSSASRPASASAGAVLICCNGSRARGELARLVEAAFAGVSRPPRSIYSASQTASPSKYESYLGAPRARC